MTSASSDLWSKAFQTPLSKAIDGPLAWTDPDGFIRYKFRGHQTDGLLVLDMERRALARIQGTRSAPEQDIFERIFYGAKPVGPRIFMLQGPHSSWWDQSALHLLALGRSFQIYGSWSSLQAHPAEFSQAFAAHLIALIEAQQLDSSLAVRALASGSSKARL